MTHAETPASLTEIERLGMQCLSHAEQEEALLAATLQLLREVRTALINRDLDRIASGLQQQQHTAKAAAELSVVRGNLRRAIGSALDVPADQATLSALASRLPEGMKTQLLTRRQQLAAMAAEVASINYGNAMLIRQSMAMLQQLLVCFTGTKQAGERYAPNGQMQRGELGSTFHADC